ncbi:MAG TPA: phospholipase A [Candidatus Aminicenantes bacterium]|nr:phospholipase A [Candidatus Aminicenantes bacterium]HRY64493.1 phospholipase A [Candidatus Aminicenantes bacterium]HRZ71406.1 phospholipase A [Candidatus Aminicenantes bacterium]
MAKSSRSTARSALVLAAFAAVLAGGLAAAPQGLPGVAAEGGAGKEKPSYFTTLWFLDEASRAGKSWITFHRPNYALVFSYNTSPNLAPLQQADPAKTLVKPEIAFQLSFKAKLWQDILGRPVDLWVGYTQRSFWQLYNFDDSSPFRETDYEPEVLFNVRTRVDVLGLRARFVQFGFNHQSNGQSEPLSRSWNRIVANVGLERGRLSLLLKGWVRLGERAVDDDNPGIVHYLGCGEFWAYYFLKRHRITVMLRDNLNFRENRGAVQLEWSFPMFPHIHGHVQYFQGYGESLLDYDHHIRRIGAGFILCDWE